MEVKFALLTKIDIDKYSLFPIMKTMKKSTLFLLILSLILLVVTGVCIYGEAQFSWLHMPRMIVGSLVVLGLPGYWITRWAFPLT